MPVKPGTKTAGRIGQSTGPEESRNPGKYSTASVKSKFFFGNNEIDIFGSVYGPREDSLLLAGCIKDSAVAGRSCLDVGCGSGIQSINLALKGASGIVAIDINEKAVANTSHNAKKLGFGKTITALQSDLFVNVHGKFDIIVFNPPYLESESLEERELDGGRKGREVLDRFLNDAGGHLTEHGKIYFLQSSLNGISETKARLKKLGLDAEIVAKNRIFFEELIVFEAVRQ